MPPARLSRRSTSPKADPLAPIRRTDLHTLNATAGPVTPASFSSPLATSLTSSLTQPAPLFPPSISPPTRRPSHHKKRPASHIPRPPNAFILFRANFIRDRHVHVPSNGSLSNVSPTTLSTIVGITWRNLPDEEREVWIEKARIAREEHKRLYPSYRYQPAPTADEKAAARASKRKMKEGTIQRADVERCEEISRLLVTGLRGEELEEAIKNFDATREMMKKEEMDRVPPLNPPRSNSLPNSPGRVRSTRRTRSHSPRRALSAGHLPPYDSSSLYTFSEEGPYPVFSDSSPDISSLELPSGQRSVAEHGDNRIPDLTYDAASPLSIVLPEEQEAAYVGDFLAESPTHLSCTDPLHSFPPSQVAPGPSPLFSSFSSLTGWDEAQALAHPGQHSLDMVPTEAPTHLPPSTASSISTAANDSSLSQTHPAFVVPPFELYHAFRQPFDNFSTPAMALEGSNLQSQYELQHRSVSGSSSSHHWASTTDMSNYHDGLSALSIAPYSPAY